MWLRLSVFAALLLMGFVLVRFTPLGDLLAKERMGSFIDGLRLLWWSPFLLVGLYTVMGPLGLPTGPLLVGGAVFGPLHGFIYNLVGLFVGAALSYLVARLLGRDFVARVTGERFRRAEHLFERHGFWPLVQTRFLPIPFPVVNFGAALAGVRPRLFLTSTLVGLIPSTMIHTYFIAKLFATGGVERAITFAMYASAFVLFNVVISILWLRGQAKWTHSALGGFVSVMRKMIFALDRLLRRSQGIFEFWDDPNCIFRVNFTHLNRPLSVPEGHIPAGAKKLELHLWNENIPDIPESGLDLAWALGAYRKLQSSLRALGDELEKNSELVDVAAVGGVTSLFSPGDGSTWEDIFSGIGFTMAPHRNSLGPFGEFWEILYAWMLTWAYTPPNSPRLSLFRIRRTDFWMSKNDFLRRYADRNTEKDNRILTSSPSKSG